MADLFRDFIPAGEDTGGLGEGGFRDFVPTPEPKHVQIDEPVAVEAEPTVIAEEPEVKPLVGAEPTAKKKTK